MTNKPVLKTSYEQALELLTRERAKPDAPALVMRLRKLFPDADVTELNLAAESYIARHLAPTKLGEWASEGHFTISLLQQASRESIATYRAALFQGREHVLEVGTGTGSDTAALARVAKRVTTIDGDPVASELAQRNLALQGITNVTFIVGNAEEIVTGLHEQFDALFADPMRRTRGGERVKSGDDYSPSLSFLLALNIGDLRAIKVSPGLFVDPCPSGWVRQFVGYGEECLEQTLWFGSTVKDSSVIVTDRHASWARSTREPSHSEAESLNGFIVEAHATINRCQHLDAFFAERGITAVAPDVAYGVTSVQPPPCELSTSYRILADLPYSKKRLKAEIARLGWSSRTELKKRSFPGDIEQIRAELDLPEHTHTSPFGVVFFFRYHGKPWAVLAERLYAK